MDRACRPPRPQAGVVLWATDISPPGARPCEAKGASVRRTQEPVPRNVSWAPGSGCPGPCGCVRMHLGVAGTSDGTWWPGGCHHLGKEATAASTAPCPQPRAHGLESWLPSASPRPLVSLGTSATASHLGSVLRLSLANLLLQLCRHYSYITLDSVRKASSLFPFSQPSK